MNLHDKAEPIALVPHPDRPRELLLSRGAAYLSDRELLAVLLGFGTKGRDVNQLAADVLRRLDSLGAPLDPADLSGITGVGNAKTATLAAALEFSRRRLCPAHRKIGFPSDVVPLLTHYADRKQEHFIVVSLNGAHEVLSIRVVSVGLLNRTIVHPREVFADPITERAAGIVIAHNHPSGRVDPSKDDRDITDRLRAAGDTLGIDVLDHIVFSATAYYSFLENGEFD